MSAPDCASFPTNTVPPLSEASDARSRKMPPPPDRALLSVILVKQTNKEREKKEKKCGLEVQYSRNTQHAGTSILSNIEVNGAVVDANLSSCCIHATTW